MSRGLLAAAISVAMFCIAAAQTPAVPDTSKPAEQPAAATDMAKAAATETANPELSIDGMDFCTDVVEREPSGAGIEFPVDVGKLFFWSNVLNDGEETSVTHVWYLNGEEKARVELPVKYPRNRIWSSKIIPAEWAGEWKVEVVTADGDVLGSKTCVVK